MSEEEISTQTMFLQRKLQNNFMDMYGHVKNLDSLMQFLFQLLGHIRLPIYDTSGSIWIFGRITSLFHQGTCPARYMSNDKCVIYFRICLTVLSTYCLIGVIFFFFP